MMRLIFAIIFTATLTGCAEFRAIQASIATHGAEGADQVLESAVYIVCNGATVGAIERRFKTDGEKEARKVICI